MPRIDADLVVVLSVDPKSEAETLGIQVPRLDPSPVRERIVDLQGSSTLRRLVGLNKPSASEAGVDA